jgi:hypothetical protein
VILEDQYMIRVDHNYMHYAMYAASKRGEKANDAIEISHHQRIRAVGTSRFYLEYLNFSKESISTVFNL